MSPVRVANVEAFLANAIEITGARVLCSVVESVI